MEPSSALCYLWPICLHVFSAKFKIIYLSQKKSDFYQSWNSIFFWDTNDKILFTLWLCAHMHAHKGKIVHTTFCKVHNPISQTNRVRFSPNLELKVVLEYQAQNIIHIVVVCTCACTQRGNVHATLCNEHNHISQPNQFGFSPKLEFMVLMGYQAPNIIHIVVVCSHARTQRDMIRKLLFSMCIIIYLS